MKNCHVGVIGYGFMGKTHTYCYKTLPLFYCGQPLIPVLDTICDPTLSKAEEARDSQGFRRAVTDPMELLHDPAIDVVSICTPNVFHKEYVLEALKAGKHVYCDKPLAASAAESREIVRALDRCPGLCTQVALQMRFYPAVMRAKQLLEEGRLGRIFLFQCDYLHSSGIDPQKPMGWKQSKAFGGGGVLLDLGAHAFDLVYDLLGEYERVFAVTDTVFSHRPDKTGALIPTDAEDTAAALIRMRCGAAGKILVSKVATGTMDELRLEIHGEKGALRFNTMEPGYLEFYDASRPSSPLGGESGFTRVDCHQQYPAPGGQFPNPRFTFGFLRAHAACMYRFLEGVAEGKPGSPSFREAAYVQEVLESCYRSVQSGAWVSVPKEAEWMNKLLPGEEKP